MTKKMISLTDAITGENIVREMNAEELAYLEQMNAETVAEQEKADQKAIQKAALLDRLGITKNEVAILLA
jgi:hypothetical protein